MDSYSAPQYKPAMQQMGQIFLLGLVILLAPIYSVHGRTMRCSVAYNQSFLTPENLASSVKIDSLQPKDEIFVVRERALSGEARVGVFEVERLERHAGVTFVFFTNSPEVLRGNDGIVSIHLLNRTELAANSALGPEKVSYFSLLADSTTWNIPAELKQTILMVAERQAMTRDNVSSMLPVANPHKVEDSARLDMREIDLKVIAHITTFSEGGLGSAQKPLKPEYTTFDRQGNLVYVVKYGGRFFEFTPVDRENIDGFRKTWGAWLLHQKLGLKHMSAHGITNAHIETADGGVLSVRGIVRQIHQDPLREAQWARIFSGNAYKTEAELLAFEFLIGNLEIGKEELFNKGKKLKVADHTQAFPDGFMSRDFVDYALIDPKSPALGVLLSTNLDPAFVRRVERELDGFMKEHGGLFTKEEIAGVYSRLQVLKIYSGRP